MNYPKLSFQVRIKSRQSLEEMGERIGQVLGCQFRPFFDQMYDQGEAFSAECLGLQIVLSHDPEVTEGAERTYVLIGSVRGDIEAELDIGVERISISQYVLGLMKICDSEEWYIAEKKELYEEAGLDFSGEMGESP